MRQVNLWPQPSSLGRSCAYFRYLLCGVVWWWRRRWQAKAAKLAKKDPGYYKKSWCVLLTVVCRVRTAHARVCFAFAGRRPLSSVPAGACWREGGWREGGKRGRVQLATTQFAVGCGRIGLAVGTERQGWTQRPRLHCHSLRYHVTSRQHAHLSYLH